jgi:hypothetical protein
LNKGEGEKVNTLPFGSFESKLAAAVAPPAAASDSEEEDDDEEEDLREHVPVAHREGAGTQRVTSLLLVHTYLPY